MSNQLANRLSVLRLEKIIPDTIEMVYLGGAVDNRPGKDNYREYATEVLNSAGVSTFNPPNAFGYTAGVGNEQVIQINEAALIVSDIALFEMDIECQHNGTAIELYRTATDVSRISVVWSSKPGIYVQRYADFIVPTLDEAIAMVLEIKACIEGHEATSIQKIVRDLYGSIFDSIHEIKR